MWSLRALARSPGCCKSRGVAVADSSLILAICEDAPAPELSLNELGSWPAGYNCVCQPDGPGLFKPAACGFHSAGLDQESWSSPERPTCPARSHPRLVFSPPLQGCSAREGAICRVWPGEPWVTGSSWRERASRSCSRQTSWPASAREGQGSGVGSSSGPWELEDTGPSPVPERYQRGQLLVATKGKRCPT